MAQPFAVPVPIFSRKGRREESKSEILRIKEFLPVLKSLRLLLPIVGNRDDEVEVSRNIFNPRPSVKTLYRILF